MSQLLCRYWDVEMAGSIARTGSKQASNRTAAWRNEDPFGLIFQLKYAPPRIKVLVLLLPFGCDFSRRAVEGKGYQTLTRSGLLERGSIALRLIFQLLRTGWSPEMHRLTEVMSRLAGRGGAIFEARKSRFHRR